MPLNKSEIRKILLISLSNIGDVILTCPVIDVLIQEFPQAQLSVVVGAKAAPLFEGNRFISQVIVFNKRQSFVEVIRWCMNLRRQCFDLVVDLRHTAIPLLLASKYRTPILRKSFLGHMKEKHLSCLKSIVPEFSLPRAHNAISLGVSEQSHLRQFIHDRERYVVLCPGAADGRKRWDETKFARLADEISQRDRLKIIFSGDRSDWEVAERICTKMKAEAVNLCGKTTLLQSAAIIRDALLVIVNDSAPLHLASYFNKPVIGIFGLTDPAQYGPWGTQGIAISKKDLVDKDVNPISLISVEDVVKSFQITSTGVLLNQ
jgi:ADP-heptose:LPS heptosyltransferase